MKPLQQNMDQIIKTLGESYKPNKLNQQKLQKSFPEYFEPKVKRILSKRQKKRQKAKGNKSEDGN